MCPRSKLNRKGMMKEELAYRIIFEAKLRDCKSVKLEWFGESLLVPYWYRIAEYAKRLGMKTILITNGSLLNKENIEHVYNFIDKISVSVNGYEKSQYEKTMIGLKFDVIIDNLKNLWDKCNKKVKILITSIDTNDNIKKYKNVFGKLSHFIILNKDNVNFEWDKKHREVKCLHKFKERLVVGCDGKCYLCCHDWLGEYPVGDLGKEGIKEIQNKKNNIILNNLEICQKCMQSSEQ